MYIKFLINALKYSSLLLISTLVLSINSKAYSANIFFTEDRPFSQLYIRGEITKGDYRKVLNVLQRNGDIPYKVSLDSKGGNVMEALKIGALVRKYLMRTETTTCNSACVFILMGSVFENENKFARYGIHRPKFNPKYFASLDMQQATVKYKTLYAIVEKYMSSMGASKTLIDRIFSIPSGSMEYLTNSQLYALLPDSAQVYSEWIIAKCGDDLNAQEQQQLIAFNQNRSLLDETYYNYLEAKSTEYFSCELESVRNEQMRLLHTDINLQTNQMSLQ